MSKAMLVIDRMSMTDIPEVVALDRASQEEPWPEAAFLGELDLPHSVVLVARLVQCDPPSEKRDESVIVKEAGQILRCGSCRPTETEACRTAKPGAKPELDPGIAPAPVSAPGRKSVRVGIIAGYVCLWLVADEAQVLNFAVHPHHRKLGIGIGLLGCALEIARQQGAGRAYLEVRKGNRAARELYQRVGFEITGERPNFYGRGDKKEAGILMTLDLGAWQIRHENPSGCGLQGCSMLYL